MKLHRYILMLLFGCLPTVCPLHAARWTTHFAYNHVTQIAVSPDKIYAISDGSLFSVDKQSEAIRVYSRQSGLHSTGITCIHYDEAGKQLIIGYETGKMDILSERGVKYIGELYVKDMTQRKTIHNVTIKGRMAYLSTHYGVQTLDLKENKLVDSYWLRPNGTETPVVDVLLQGDSIYAFTDDSLFCAAMSDNLVDYTFWKREARTGRISPDPKKGKEYSDATDTWYAGNSEGIVRFSNVTGQRMAYKPEGPLVNVPYRLTATDKNLWMVPGGRWSAQYENAGLVMRYDGQRWINIPMEAIRRRTGRDVLDFMNVAADPKDETHYFVTSYGTGLYEFRKDTLYRHFLPDAGNTLLPANNDTLHYTRLDGAVYDEKGSLWMVNAMAESQLQSIDAQGRWHAVDVAYNGEPLAMHTPAGLIIDRKNARRKWLATARFNTFVCLLDDGGTAYDNSDDRTMLRQEWRNQHGHAFAPTILYSMMQDRAGRVWLATEQGAAYIDAETDFFTSDAIIQPDVMDNNGENPITSLTMQSVCQTPDGLIWLGTKDLGVYVLNDAATEIVAHYTTDNSAMPANGILSLASNAKGHIFIGTADGLVEYDPDGPDEGLHDADEDEGLEQGSMLQWKLHFSYCNPQEIAASPKRIYAMANGSLFSVDRADETITYWNKSTGLNGNSVNHIAYDAVSGKLVITYENGQIDLLSDDDAVTQMPDISMKAGSIAVDINSIGVGARQVYLAMPFGIIALNAHKGEISDTYYIGEEAVSVDVRQVMEVGDTLFAFSYDRLYKASLKDNIVDFTFWQSEALPFEQVQQAVVWRDEIHVLQDNQLYRRKAGGWQQVRPERIEWINSNDGQLVLYIPGAGLFRLGEDDQLAGLSNLYIMNAGLYSRGEYWVCERNWGLICLRTTGDGYFHTDGPNSNFGYSMCAAHNRIYSVIGGRWAGEYGRLAKLNIFDGQNWRSYNSDYIYLQTRVTAVDPVSVAVDPKNAGHFFVATYGSGILEFDNFEIVGQHTTGNSTLLPAAEGADPDHYTRTDGAMMDEQGNLWVMNATTIGKPLHVLSPDGIWHGMNLYSEGVPFTFTTPAGIWTDRRDTKRKWMFDQRYSPAVILLDDGGTPTVGGDDRCIKRSSFTDQNGNILTPANFRCFAQDHTNRIWLGTEKGLIVIPSNVDFFTSNACKRIIIPRNDGTGLGDYLLGDEQINCMAVDGGNRLWLGTETSGLYLIEDDTITVAHFTETNSLLPSNTIQSIAIMPSTGEVFIGTDKGIASYRSDASEAEQAMSNAYAYPNPVRPDYGGVISITGLMENTVVNIVDAGGNLVCKTRSHGGTAVWDGRLPDGRRATPGVYSALCNADGGHTVVKILVVR